MRITLPSGTAAEIATPASGAPIQGLVVIPDIGGMRPLFDDLAARLAEEYGWVVVVAEPFPGLEDQPVRWRMDHAGDVSRRPPPRATWWPRPTPPGWTTSASSASAWAACTPSRRPAPAASPGRSASTGWSGCRENWQSEGSVEPLDAVVADGACPVLLIAGSEDHWTPADDLAALESAGGTVVVYEGADHGFVHDPSRPAHRADDAADAWRRAIAFLNGQPAE